MATCSGHCGQSEQGLCWAPPLCSCSGLAGGCRNPLHQLCDRVRYPGWKRVSSSKGAAYGRRKAMGWLNHPPTGQLNRKREHNSRHLPAVTSFSALWLANRTFLAQFFSPFLPFSPAYLWFYVFHSNFWEVDLPIPSPAHFSLLLPNVISPPNMLELPKAKGVECEETKGFVWFKSHLVFQSIGK